MNFRVGQKVVCVDDCKDLFGQPSGLRVGTVYTVRGIDRDEKSISFNGAPGVYLIGIFRERMSGRERSYRAIRFRPVVEKKTDISIFTEMLKPRELVRSHD